MTSDGRQAPQETHGVLESVSARDRVLVKLAGGSRDAIIGEIESVSVDTYPLEGTVRTVDVATNGGEYIWSISSEATDRTRGEHPTVTRTVFGDTAIELGLRDESEINFSDEYVKLDEGQAVHILEHPRDKWCGKAYCPACQGYSEPPAAMPSR